MFENVKEKSFACFCNCVSVFFLIRDGGERCWRMLKRKLLGVSVAGFLFSL